MEEVLTISGLGKRYGSIVAVDSLNLTIPRGTVYGLLGPNGSGKTTTLGVILGIIQATAGNYSWFNGLPTHLARQRIGAILEQPNFYPYLTGYQNLRLICKIKETDPGQIDDVLKRVNLYERKDSKFKTYSLGMKQRLALGATLLGDPEVIVLDEPTNGLDPKGIVEVRDLIGKIANEGKTILLASHLLDEVEKVCTHVAVLKKGVLLETRAIHEEEDEEITLQLKAQDGERLLTALKNLPGIMIVQVVDGIVIAKSRLQPSEINKACFDQGLVLSHLSVKRRSLEDRFLEITE